MGDWQPAKLFPSANMELDPIVGQMLAEELLVIFRGSPDQADYERLFAFRSEPVGENGIPAQLFQNPFACLI